MRRIWLLPLVALLMVSAPQIGVGCSCVPFTKPQLVENASVIFTGTVSNVSAPFPLNPSCTISSADPVTVTFRVETVFKGDAARNATVSTVRSGASCGYEFMSGRRYTVFATLTDGKLETNLCRGNVEGTIDPAEYGLTAGHPPR